MITRGLFQGIYESEEVKNKTIPFSRNLSPFQSSRHGLSSSLSFTMHKHVDEKSVGEVRTESYNEGEVLAVKPKLTGKVLNYTLAFVAGTGFTLFG